MIRPRLIILALLSVLLLSATGTQAQVPVTQGTQPSTAFTYQGQLTNASGPVNSTCNFQFSLFDTLEGGNQIGAVLPMNDVQVVNGLFAVSLDFDTYAFTRDARWLQTAVQCRSEANFTTLTPRLALTAAPYALNLVPGATLHGESPDDDGVVGITHLGTKSGVFGFNESGTGITGGSKAGAGVIGASDTGQGVAGFSKTWQGVYGHSDSQAGVVGESNGFDGMYGISHNNGSAGVSGHNDQGGYGVWGNSNGGFAMYAAGNSAQERDKGGWVKAMVLIDPFQPNPIVRCYNSQTTGGNVSGGNCGFTASSSGVGFWTIDFGFKVTDRFASVTPFYDPQGSPGCGIWACAGGAAIGANVEIITGNPQADTKLHVDLFYVDDARKFTNSRFFVIVY